MNVKALVFQRKPLSRVDHILTSQGFTKIGAGPSITYRTAIRDSSTESLYILEIPVEQTPNDSSLAKVGRPYLFGRERIPEQVRFAAESKLYEIADYLKTKLGKKAEKLSKHNGQMTHNENEIRRLGKEMESIKTHAELNEMGLTSDPIPYE